MVAPARPLALTPASVHGPSWRAFAFGLEVEGDFAAPGLDSVFAPRHDGAPRACVAAMSAEDVLARWRGDPSAHVVYEHRSAEAPPILVIDARTGPTTYCATSPSEPTS